MVTTGNTKRTEVPEPTARGKSENREMMAEFSALMQVSAEIPPHPSLLPI